MSNEANVQSPADPRRRWVVLAVLCIGMLMVVLDGTVVNVALPSIQRDLGFSPMSIAWVVNSYLITFGGLLLFAGRLGDLWSPKKVFITGLLIFTVASLFCGAAPTRAALVGARFLQGVGSAFTASVILGILVTLFPEPREQAKAIGYYAFSSTAGSSIGLLAGGTLTELLSWHWIFLINLPVGLVASLLAWRLIEDRRGEHRHGGVDVIGALLITATPMLLVYAIIAAGDHGFTSRGTIAAASGALVALVLFILVEARIADPLVPLRIFRSRTLVVSNLVRVLSLALSSAGWFFTTGLFLQRGIGFGAQRTGFSFMPTTLTIAFFSLGTTTRLVARFGPKRVMLAGLMTSFTGLLWFSRLDFTADYWTHVLPGMVVIGTGSGMSFIPLVGLSMADAKPGDSGLVSGLTNVSQQVGGALGIAVLASISQGAARDLAARGVLVREALLQGFHRAYLFAAAAVLFGIVIAAVFLRPTPRRRIDMKAIDEATPIVPDL